MAESGVLADGEWTPAFPGQRPPFERGHQLSLKHGAYSTIAIGARAEQIAAEVREIVPVCSPADEPIIRLFAQTLAQVERATAALEQLAQTMEGRPLGPYLVEDATKLQRLREDTRGWVNTARRLANDLGLTPTSRARLGLNLASAQREMSVIEYYAAREAAGLPVDDDDLNEDEAA